MGGDLPTFRDAHDKERSARDSLSESKYKDAIFHAQECIDFSVKAFLHALEIEFELRHSLKEDHFRKASKMLEQKTENEWTHGDARAKLARAKVLMDLLGNIRSYAEGYAPLHVYAGEVFDYRFKEFAESVVKLAGDILSDLKSLVAKMGLQVS